MLGPHCVHHWGKQQDRIALSSGEAELKATCKGVSELLGMAQIMNFFTRQSQALEHRMDASATERMVLRQGSGQLKHLDIRELWVQAAVVEHGIKVVKIPRTENYADILCSVPRKEEFNEVLESLGFHFPNPCHGQGGKSRLTTTTTSEVPAPRGPEVLRAVLRGRGPLLIRMPCLSGCPVRQDAADVP